MPTDLEGRAIRLSIIEPTDFEQRARVEARRGWTSTKVLEGTVVSLQIRRSQSRGPYEVALSNLWAGGLDFEDRKTGLMSIKPKQAEDSLEDLLRRDILVEVTMEDPAAGIMPPDPALPHYLGVAWASLILPWVRNFDEAKAADDGYFVMEGDWGGGTYIKCPMRLVSCSEEALRALHDDLDRIDWNEPEGRQLVFASRSMDRVAGHTDAYAPDDLWINQLFVGLGLEDRIRELIAGRRGRIGSPEEIADFRRRARARLGLGSGGRQ